MKKNRIVETAIIFSTRRICRLECARLIWGMLCRCGAGAPPGRKGKGQMEKKQRKTERATENSRHHMSGMYNYSDVTHRVYQTEKRVPSGASRYTRIQSKEELKHRADMTVTARNILRAENYLDAEIPKAPAGEVESKYGLKYDETENEKHGDSVLVFQLLCEKYPMARNYISWNDLFQCIKDHKPVRTTPIKIIRAAQEKTVLPVDMVEPIYEKGTELWTIYREHVLVECDRCGGRGKIATRSEFVNCWKCSGTGKMESKTETQPKIAKVSVVSWYKKRLNDGSFDVMYELDGCGAFGEGRNVWRLQGGGNLFETEDAAVRYLHGETGDVSDV